MTSDASTLIATQPYTPHEFDVLCPSGHVLTTTPFRVAPGFNASETKIWAVDFTPSVVQRSTEQLIANVPKTMERCLLDSTATAVVTKVTAVCRDCGNNVGVGTIVTDYADCSDLSVDCGAQRFEPRPLKLMLLFKRNDCRLQVRFRSNAAPLTPFVGVAGEEKTNAESLLGTMFRSEPPLAALLGVTAGDDDLVRRLERGANSPEKRYILATTLARFFSVGFERLHVKLGVCGDFLLASGLPHPKRSKQNIYTDLLGPNSSYLEAVQEFVVKKRQQIDDRAVDELCVVARAAQTKQMAEVPKNPCAHQPLLSALFVTRNAVAHSRDVSGRERRHLLRLFVKAFGRGDVLAAIDFVERCIAVLQINILSNLGRSVSDVSVCQHNAKNQAAVGALAAELADKETEARRAQAVVVQQIRAAVLREN